MFEWRHIFCLPIIAVLPALLQADEAPTAMLLSSGTGVLVNKNAPPPSTALFAGDLIETQKNAVARIEASGSAANINPETLVEFKGNELVLEHGSLSVNTTHGLRVRVGCLTLEPGNNAQWTHYDVADVDGKVTISALKNDVIINAGPGRLESAGSAGSTVREGQQITREEKCGGHRDNSPIAVTGGGNAMSSPWVIGGAAAGIGILTCVVLCRGSGPSPISPSQ